jgi:hypothetical protein
VGAELGAELEPEAEVVGLFDEAGAGLLDDPQAATERAAAAVTAMMAYRMSSRCGPELATFSDGGEKVLCNASATNDQVIGQTVSDALWTAAAFTV